MRVVVVALMLALLPSLAHAGIYRWEDDAGVVHFTNNINKIPVERRPVVKGSDTKPAVRPKTARPVMGQVKHNNPHKALPLSAGAMRPREVYMDFYHALQGMDFKIAEQYLSFSLKARLSQDNKGHIAESVSSMKSAFIHSARVRNESIRGERANVVVSGTYEGDDYVAKIDFVLEGGSWKILNDNWEQDD